MKKGESNNTRAYGYVRVSTKEQNPERQVAELIGHGVNERDIYVDKITGRTKADNRPEYQVLKHSIRPGDTLYIHELDRLGRNKAVILEELRYYKEQGIRVKILDLPTTMQDHSGKDGLGSLMYELINNVIIEIMATMAQAELEKIKKRQREGIDVAIANGVKFGRRKIEIDEKFIVHYDEWKAKKITAVEAMKRTGLKRSTFYNLVKEYEKDAK